MKRIRISKTHFKSAQAGNGNITRCECGFDEAEGKMVGPVRQRATWKPLIKRRVDAMPML